jgi:hypothetical protein
VFIDILASGGYPLFIAYMAIVVMSLIAAIKLTFIQKDFNFVKVGLITTWICYQVQSIISINQIGLAVWGWVLSGTLIAYSRIIHLDSSDKQVAVSLKRQRGKTQQSVISPQLVAGLGFLVGLLIAVPPLAADMKWRQAIQSRDLAKAEAALVPSYLNPSDSYRFADAVDTLMASNLTDQALKYTLQAVEFNPDYFTAWRMLYLLPNSSSQQKTLAMSNMRRLDPNNPDVVNN